MGNIYNLGRGMERIDISENHIKNRLPIGTVLLFNGYGNARLCVVKNLGISEGFASSGATYETVNIETGAMARHNMLGCDHISTKRDNRIAVYYTDEILTADEIMDLIKKAENKKNADIAAKAAADQARALELERLQRDYAHLEKVEGSKKSSHALGASNIRRELKNAFPGIKFSVTSESYSMGCSIFVSWMDSITTEEVDKIICKYQWGTFDSMTDCSGSLDSVFIDRHGGARHVNAHRHLSDAAYNTVAIKMGYPEAVFNPRQGDFDGVNYEISQMIKREAWETKF